MARLLFTPHSFVVMVAVAAALVTWQGHARSRDAAKKQADFRPVEAKKAGRRETLPEGVIALSELATVQKDTQAADDATERKLQATIDVDFKDVKLRDALKSLSQGGRRFPLVIGEDALKQEGITGDEKVKLHLRGATIEHVLLRLLDRRDIRWLIHDGSVHITTQTIAEARKFVRMYTLEGLECPEASWRMNNKLALAAAGESRLLAVNGTQYDWILDAIQAHTSANWAEGDADPEGGTMVLVNKSLIVRQGFNTHREISEMLRGFRIAARGKLQGGMFFLRRRNYPHEKDRLIRKKLHEPATVRFQKIAINKALREIEKKTGIPLWMDTATLKDQSIELDKEISFDARMISWGTALERLLEPIAAAYRVDQGTIRIEPVVVQSERLMSAMFDIGDLLAAGYSARRVASTIRTQAGGLWRDTDGIGGGTISVNSDFRIAVVMQSPSLIRNIARLVQDWRRNLASSMKNSSGRISPKGYRSRVETRFYTLNDSSKANELAAAIPVFVETDTWNRRDVKPAIKAVGGTLIVRQTVKVHNAVREFILDLEPPNPVAQGGLGAPGGGFFSVPRRGARELP